MTGFFAIAPKLAHAEAGASIGIYVAFLLCSQTEIIHVSVNMIFPPSLDDFQFSTLEVPTLSLPMGIIRQFISLIGEYFERIDVSDS